MPECPRLSILDYAPTTVLNEWYITNQCGASWPRVMLYGINLVLFLVSVLGGFYLIRFNFKKNPKWLNTQLCRPILTAHLTNFIYLWVYVAALLGTPGSEVFLIVGWWFAINAGNAFQVAASYAWITPIKHLRNLNSATSTAISSVLDILSNLQFIILLTSIAFNLAVVTAHVVFYKRDDAHRVWLIHTLFHVGIMIFTTTFTWLFAWACVKLRAVLVQNFEELGQAMGKGSTYKAAVTRAGSVKQRDAEKQSTTSLPPAPSMAGTISNKGGPTYTLSRANTSRGNDEKSDTADGSSMQRQQIEAILGLLEESLRVSRFSGYVSGVMQLAIIIWVIVVRSPEGMAGVNYVYPIRSIIIAASTCKAIYIYGYVKVRDELELKQRSKMWTASRAGLERDDV
ncbi:hypothetical protein BC832DRAFT_542558 [Gaertneriomyces semiglobifer]|nr:hypothetical protein BC832DRAFT_542558 [Gaertneriomyces semiglobifer]